MCMSLCVCVCTCICVKLDENFRPRSTGAGQQPDETRADFSILSTLIYPNAQVLIHINSSFINVGIT